MSDEDLRRDRKRFVVALLAVLATIVAYQVLYDVGRDWIGFCCILFGIAFQLVTLPVIGAAVCLIPLRMKLRGGAIVSFVWFLAGALGRHETIVLPMFWRVLRASRQDWDAFSHFGPGITPRSKDLATE